MTTTSLRAALLLFACSVGAAGCEACRKGESTDGQGPDAAPSASSSASPEDGADEDPFGDDVDLGASAVAEAGAADAGGKACTGREIDAIAALADPRCAITAIAARKLREGLDDAGARVAFVQRATVEEDGTVTLRVVNEGSRAVTVPLLDHPDLPAVTALAQEAEGAIHELAAPALRRSTEAVVVASDGGADGGAGTGLDAGTRRARLAKVRVPRGGAVVLHLVVDPTITKRVRPPCPADRGSCGQGRLAPGAYILHLGQLVVDVEAGAPARVAWLNR